MKRNNKYDLDFFFFYQEQMSAGLKIRERKNNLKTQKL